MLISNRSIVAALAGLTLLCGIYSPDKGYAAKSAASDTTQQVTQAAGVPSVDEVGRRDSPTNDLTTRTRDQSYYNREDLKAQKSMAWWTKAMGIAAIVGVILSTVGVGLIYTTFKATRVAAEAAVMAQRPWLDAKIKVHGIAKSETGYALRIEILVENVGNTPANQLRCGIDGWFYEDSPDEEPFTSTAYKRIATCIKQAIARVSDAIERQEKDGLTVFPRSVSPIFTETEIATAKENDGLGPVAWLAVSLGYSYGGGDGRTVRVFQVRSFGIPNETGFDSIGEYGHAFTDTPRAKIVDWQNGNSAT